MQVLHLPEGGIIGGGWRRLRTPQLVVCQADGTPFLVIVEHIIGGDVCQTVAQAGDPEFQKLLAVAGINEKTQCSRIALPQPPSGAKLVSQKL